jgi:hypothetical protein
MNNLTRPFVTLAVLVPLLAAGAGFASPAPSLTEHPARIDVAVSPGEAHAGDRVEVTLRIVPKDGVKINRYPKIRFQVDAREGLVDAAETSLGNDGPPPPDKMETNYFDRVEPLTLTLPIDDDAGTGRHEIEGQVTFFYCVTKSGFCAPKKDRVKIALNLR